MSVKGRVEKLMTLSLSEFQGTIKPLLGQRLDGNLSSAEIPVGPHPGRVVVEYESRPNARLGGLLDLPRALVSLTFDGVSPADQATFVKRFDLAFQRGGG